MFKRKIENDLLEWKNKENRKPLVLRGARQTGKTTVIREFAKGFNNFVELNLELLGKVEKWTGLRFKSGLLGKYFVDM